jgi:hypothetical protein
MTQEEQPGAAADLPDAAATFPSRNATSKYDFVKVKVWLGENAHHYYVLSRFLLSRMLTVTKVSLSLSAFYSLTLPVPLLPVHLPSQDCVSFLHPFQIPNHVAIKIALELKKLLVDNSLLDVYAPRLSFPSTSPPSCYYYA